MNKEGEIFWSLRDHAKAKLEVESRFLSRLEGEAEINVKDKLQLQNRYHDLKLIYGEFDQAQLKIEGDEVHDWEEEMQNRVDFSERYNDIKSRFNMLMGVSVENVKKELKNVADDKSGSVQEVSVRLPDIPLPKFDAAFTNWMNFRDTFSVMVINNPR